MSQNTITASSGNVSSSVKVKRPRFDDLIKPYSIVAAESACFVFKRIHSDLWKECINKNPNFQNACATRMSYAFNKGGYKIKLPRKFMDEKTAEPYVTSVLDMIRFLEKNFGVSDVLFTGNIVDFKNKLSKKRGIIVFKIKWADANGHVTLWDGTKCVDNSDHFVDSPTEIYFWELK